MSIPSRQRDAGDVKQLLLHRICRDDDLIDGLALTAMRRNGVAIRELAIVRRHTPTIFQMYDALAHIANRRQFAGGCADPLLFTIAHQQ